LGRRLYANWTGEFVRGNVPVRLPCLDSRTQGLGLPAQLSDRPIQVCEKQRCVDGTALTLMPLEPSVHCERAVIGMCSDASCERSIRQQRYRVDTSASVAYRMNRASLTLCVICAHDILREDDPVRMISARIVSPRGARRSRYCSMAKLKRVIIVSTREILTHESDDPRSFTIRIASCHTAPRCAKHSYEDFGRKRAARATIKAETEAWCSMNGRTRVATVATGSESYNERAAGREGI
jgi:hypothetical protein